MCLNGNATGGVVQVTTLKHQSFWQRAAGEKCREMAAQVPFGECVADVSALPSFTPTEETDYRN